MLNSAVNEAAVELSAEEQDPENASSAHKVIAGILLGILALLAVVL